MTTQTTMEAAAYVGAAAEDAPAFPSAGASAGARTEQSGAGAGPRPLKPCGTPAAYARHVRRGEPVDDACTAAHRQYKRRWAAKSRVQYPMGTCAACEQWRPIQRHDWCEACNFRWYRAGRPESGPPPLDPEAVRANRARAAAEARAARQLYEAIRRGGWEWAVKPRPGARA